MEYGIQHRAAGLVPHTSIDTEAHWTKSGWHGCVYGWKLRLVATVAAVWIPLAAELTPANTADNEQALRLLPELPPAVGYVLGDQHYNALDVRAACDATGRIPTPMAASRCDGSCTRCARGRSRK